MEKDTYCLCGQPYSVGQFMIECDCCREWFHGNCVDVKVYQSEDIDKYHCPKCSQIYGPSVLKLPTNSHRQDRYEVGAETRPAQTGTPAWVADLAARPLRPHNLEMHQYTAQQFTEETVRDSGFTKPVFFNSSEGLGMTMPNAMSFTPRTVLRYCGANMEIEVIEVRKQTSLRMPLGDMVDYMETPHELRDEKVLNVLSLEVSDTDMSPLIIPPRIVRELDWAERVWPVGESRARPAVQKYCLISAAGSYTDFHVDFGGTSVWYHALRGRKIFYLVPPTATNLALYQQWNTSNNQSERFFGDLVEWYGTVQVCTGQTLFIPTGWIHAVLTPQDSIVFGGNFLHSYAMELQLQINEIERRVDTPVAFRYPLFETMHWYAGAHLVDLLRKHNEEKQDEDYTMNEVGVKVSEPELPASLVRGIRILTTALKEWHALKSTEASKRDNVPKCVNSVQLVRELSRELRRLEKHKPRNGLNKDKDWKVRSSPTKPQDRRPVHTPPAPLNKPIKLTLPKPIMHMAHLQDYQHEYYPDVKTHYDQGYMESKPLVMDTDMVPDAGYGREYEEPQLQNFTERTDGSSVLRIKLGSSSRQQSYEVPVNAHRQQQWSISKKDESERLLFTNEGLAPPNTGQVEEVTYGPGMYSARELVSDCQYSESATPGSYRPDYAYSDSNVPVHSHQQYGEVRISEVGLSHECASYGTEQRPYPHHERLPSYDAAVAYNMHRPQYQQPPPIETNGTPAPAPAPVPVRRSERPVRRRLSDTYSYEEQELMIDESPTRRRRHHKISRNMNNYRQRPSQRPTNGIESLIQASVLAEEPPDNTEDVAVAGMLSMGGRLGSAATAPSPPAQTPFGLPQTPPVSAQSGGCGSRRARRPVPSVTLDEEDFADDIKEVHRDEEFVYPSLEMSSDDDDDSVSSRKRRPRRHHNDARRDKDEAWCPRARVGRVAPRLRGPGRAGVRREAVRKALQAAAQHTNTASAVVDVKRPPPPPPQPKRRPLPRPPPQPTKTISRPKKGMKTAKQRLGKILKIHKMIY